jgi:hypothetical protein
MIKCTSSAASIVHSIFLRLFMGLIMRNVLNKLSDDISALRTDLDNVEKKFLSDGSHDKYSKSYRVSRLENYLSSVSQPYSFSVSSALFILSLFILIKL